MQITRLLLAVLLCIAVPTTILANDAGYKVTYDGGSLPDQKTGASMQLVMSGDHVILLKDKSEVINIPASSITEISYGQDVHR